MLRRQKEFIEYRKSTLKMRKKFLAGSSSLMATSLKELFFIEDLVKNHGYKGKIYASAPLTRGCAEGTTHGFSPAISRQEILIASEISPQPLCLNICVRRSSSPLLPAATSAANFIVPNHWDADTVIFVANGRGTASLMR
ncbi:hypothetical protein ABFS82_08G236500 [Erythranthe guttata]